MAASETPNVANLPHRIGIARLAATLGAGAALILVLCWIATFIPVSSPTHAYIGLFTSAESSSSAALIEGSVWSFLFGALTGMVLAALYNLFALLDRR
ncbi:MAG: hypothetical protein ABIO80_06125 [Sphingomicrobium sp.]